MTATRKGVAGKPKLGRPSTFSEAKADRICQELSAGISLVEICEAEGMPSIPTVYRWLDQRRTGKAYAAFRDAYARARETAAHVLVQQCFGIADDGRNDWIERLDAKGESTGTYMVNGEAVQRSKLRVDTRKWAASKLLPKVYGERVTTEMANATDDSGKPQPLQIEHVGLGPALEAAAAALDKALG